MPRFVRAVAGCRTKELLRHVLNGWRARITLLFASSIVVIAVGCAAAQPGEMARSDDQPPAGPIARALVAPAPSRFVTHSRETLKTLQDKMAGLGVRVLAGLDLDDPAEADVASQRLTVESAQAGIQQAVLAREAAEIDLKEYEDAVFPQEKKTRESELAMAQAELERADRAIQPASERFARIKQASSGSAADLAAAWRYEGGVLSAQLQRKKAMFVLDQAQSKLKVLLDFEHGRRVKELNANLEKARSGELAKRVIWEREQSKLKRLQNPTRSHQPLADEKKQILVLIERAIPLEEQLSTRIAPLKDDAQPGEALRQEITDLTGQLQGIVDQAVGVQAAAALARLKSGLDRPGRRPFPSPDREAAALPLADATGHSLAASELSGLVAASRQQLNSLQAAILAVGDNVLERLQATDRPRYDAIDQNIKVKSAEADFENAKLAREIAEIAVVEYTEGIFKQELATLSGAVKLAESEASRSHDAIELAKFRLAKIKQASKGSAGDLATEHSFEDWVVEATQRAPRARLALENAQSKLDILNRFISPQRTKVLQGEVEKLRSDELAKAAQWEREKLKLKKLQEAGRRQTPSEHEERARELLKRAIPIVEQLTTRLEQAEKDRQPGGHLRTEFTAILEQLQILVERAEVENAAAQWATLKPKVLAAATRYLGAKK